MRNRVVIVAVALLFGCSNAFGQFQVNFGYALSTWTTTIASDYHPSERFDGFTAGVGYSFVLSNNLYLTPGLNYLFAGMKLATDENWTRHYLNIPVTLGYDLAFARNAKFFVFAGPTASFGLASTTKVTASALGYQANTRIDNYDGDGYKRFDIMIGGGAGIKFADKYCFKVGYDYGLLNRIDSSNASEHRGQLTVGIAYLF